MANYLTDPYGNVIEATRPLPVRDVGEAHEREAISAESVTFVTGAAGFTGVVALDKGPVASLRGDKVGSFWQQQKNLKLAAGPRRDGDVARITAVTETATSADVTINDSQFNLEQLFEETNTTRHHIIRITSSGGSLYGWIGGVAATGNSYVISVHNARSSGAQSWVGTLADFAFTNVGDATFEIYSYESSFVWVTGTVLTREVEYKDGGTEVEMLDAMSNGDFAIDYQRGRILYKKATTGTSDTCNYSVLKPYVTVSGTGTFTVDTEADLLARTTGNEEPGDTADALIVHDTAEIFQTVADNRRVVAAAGTALTLTAGATAARYVIITAESDNTGDIAVGASTVVAALTTRRGTILGPGDSVTMRVPGSDLVNLYIDSTVTGDGVSFLYLN